MTSHTTKLVPEMSTVTIPRRDTRTEFETVAEFTLERWEGHWEVWEREWPCAHWVWDLRNSAVRVPRAAVTRQAVRAGG
jgi:hypothetical protein